VAHPEETDMVLSISVALPPSAVDIRLAIAHTQPVS
jgi:hypothetical protein